MDKGRSLAYAAAASVFVLDRLTKLAVEQRIGESEAWRVIPGFFDLVHSENQGVAFGIFNDSTLEWRSLALAVISAAAVVFIGAYLSRARHIGMRMLWGLALILGGAAGNAYDRILSGHVTDFLDFYVGVHHWPAFNVADSAIVIGSGLLVMDMLLTKRQAANVS